MESNLLNESRGLTWSWPSSRILETAKKQGKTPATACTVTNFGARLYGQRDGILRGQGILLISALASMVLLLSFFWVPKPKQILTDCIFLKTRKNHFYSEYILEKIMLILSTRIITFCVFSTLPSSSLFFPSHSHLLTKLN